ncbi:hypothetical protein GCM10007094_16560 [Pseudovibrio japonicus]|uniref:Uncharacterized protein n=1 Tax=Pseudovibrio japonicus TaxID=366534 RepID=A0ABQ3E7N4_9HYPH|nr:hypothetical protein GCM10007094_16560 [Pseudovibrio japonicus]
MIVKYTATPYLLRGFQFYRGASGSAMPTLTRLLSIIGLIVTCAVLSMYLLVSYVEPEPREIIVEIQKEGFE